jgi:hypothetical protein
VDLMRVKGEAQWLHKRSSMRLLSLDVFVGVCAANHTDSHRQLPFVIDTIPLLISILFVDGGIAIHSHLCFFNMEPSAFFLSYQATYFQS